MKKILFAVLMITALFNAGCKSSDSGDPKAVLIEFFDALARGDIEKAKKLSTSDSQQILALLEMGMKNNPDELKKFDKTKFQFGTAVINGDQATVPTKETTSGETVNYPMKKVEGKWKVAFDKTSLMTMGMEKMKEKGMNPADSINKAMDKLKDMDMDSIQREINKSMDTANHVQ